MLLQDIGTVSQDLAEPDNSSGRWQSPAILGIKQMQVGRIWSKLDCLTRAEIVALAKDGGDILIFKVQENHSLGTGRLDYVYRHRYSVVRQNQVLRTDANFDPCATGGAGKGLIANADPAVFQHA